MPSRPARGDAARRARAGAAAGTRHASALARRSRSIAECTTRCSTGAGARRSACGAPHVALRAADIAAALDALGAGNARALTGGASCGAASAASCVTGAGARTGSGARNCRCTFHGSASASATAASGARSAAACACGAQCSCSCASGTRISAVAGTSGAKHGAVCSRATSCCANCSARASGCRTRQRTGASADQSLPRERPESESQASRACARLRHHRVLPRSSRAGEARGHAARELPRRDQEELRGIRRADGEGVRREHDAFPGRAQRRARGRRQDFLEILAR